MTKSEWASWTMALGSVIAVLVAVWVPYKQDKKERFNDQKNVALRNSELSRLCYEFSLEVKIAIEKVLEKFNGQRALHPYTSRDRLFVLQSTGLILLKKNIPNQAAVTVMKIMAVLSLTLQDTEMSENLEYAQYEAFQGKIEHQLSVLHTLIEQLR